MTSTIFFVPGEPKPQPRARATVRGGHARMYNPSTADAWKTAVRVAASEAGLMGEALDCPIKLELQFQFQRPTSHSTKAGIKPSSPQYHTQRPDLDNLAKAVMDALTDVGVWEDDDQVFDLRVTKGWEPKTSGCWVTIWK